MTMALSLTRSTGQLPEHLPRWHPHRRRIHQRVYRVLSASKVRGDSGLLPRADPTLVPRRPRRHAHLYPCRGSREGRRRTCREYLHSKSPHGCRRLNGFRGVTSVWAIRLRRTSSYSPRQTSRSTTAVLRASRSRKSGVRCRTGRRRAPSRRRIWSVASNVTLFVA